MKTLLLENIHPTAADQLNKKGLEVTSIKSSLEEGELVSALKGVALLGIRSRTHITKRVLEEARDLQAIGAYCIGTNQIDLEAASLRGVAVFNAPYSNTRSVAELVIAEIVFLVRRLYDKVVRAHQGVWDKSADNAREVRGKKLGIIGFGNIGSQVSTLAEGMGMDVYYYDIVDRLNIGNATRMQTLSGLLKVADVITVHVDGNPANKNLIDEEQFRQMTDGVVLLNLSRGHVVNIEALTRNLKSGKVAGAAIDVFPEEPKDPKEPFKSQLQGLPNVLLTPHIGGSTEEAQENIAEFVSNKLLDYAQSGSTFTSVNFPRINLPKPDDPHTHRLLHVHKNVPGVLSQINGIFAKNNVNVVSQYLRTNELIGYAIADVDKEYNDSLFDDLVRVDHTIRV
ncbi:MAG TPA: phosphoglycerate dehydrogenase, partial [Bacteroidota bacterium]|nr:phosphoglycerate dehydrogenase [Bacteroidota bacterium]